MITYRAGLSPVVDGEEVGSVPKPTKEVLTFTRKRQEQTPLLTNLRTDGPTLEVWLKAGYLPEKYPPEGYAELPSKALEAYKEFKATAAGQSDKQPRSVNDVPEGKA